MDELMGFLVDNVLPVSITSNLLTQFNCLIVFSFSFFTHRLQSIDNALI